MKDIEIFCLNATKAFANKVTDFLDVPLAKHRECTFEDGEPYIRSGVNVRNKDIYIIHSLYTDEDENVLEKFTKLLFFVGSIKDSSARRITLVIPYMAFARQDRKTESRAPITTKYCAQLLEAVGANRLLTMDIHNLAALQNGFRHCIPDNLEAKNLHADYIFKHYDASAGLTILSPDAGGMGRCVRFRDALIKRDMKDVQLAYFDKNRLGEKLTGKHIIGCVEDRQVVIYDDMISSAGSANKAAKAVTEHGGFVWALCATHGLCVGKVNENLAEIPRVIITDTIATKRLRPEVSEKTQIISTAKLFGQAVRRTHEGESISSLLQ
jgi:ribose-phosphate pyrophosphokinase